MKVTIRPLTPDLWPALEDLFGKRGASNGCWCMYGRIGATYRKRPPERNKADFRALVKRGPPPSLLAFDGDLDVGWCQLTPRDAGGQGIVVIGGGFTLACAAGSHAPQLLQFVTNFRRSAFSVYR